MFNSFCSWFDQEIAKQEFSSLLGEALQEQRCFKKKIKTTKGKKVAVFSGLLKSQISLSEEVSKQEVGTINTVGSKTTQTPVKSVSKSLVLTWFNGCVDINEEGPASKDELFKSFCSWLGSNQHNIKQNFFSILGNLVLEKQVPFEKKIQTVKGRKVIYFSGLGLKSLRAVPISNSDIKYEICQIMGNENPADTTKSLDAQDLTIITHKSEIVAQDSNICQNIEIDNQCSLQEIGVDSKDDRSV